MRRSHAEEFLGVDVGDKRVGIARGSSLARLTEPLKTVAATEALAEIEILAQRYRSAGIVVGRPRSLDGAETAQTAKIRRWVNHAKSSINQPFYWQDEALSSYTVAQNGPPAQGIDAGAASIILQDFLDTPAEQRVRC